MSREDKPYVNPLLLEKFGDKPKKFSRSYRPRVTAAYQNKPMQHAQGDSYDTPEPYLVTLINWLRSGNDVAEASQSKASKLPDTLPETSHYRPEAAPNVDARAETSKTRVAQKQSRGANKGLKRTIIFIALIAGIVVVWQPISDSVAIANADPAITKLAQDAGMSRAGELAFIRTNPAIVSSDQMQTDCPTDNSQNGFVEQGCYVISTHKIYIRSMPSELYDVEVVTAAHEMLHAVYNNDTTLNNEIEQYYHSLSDSELQARMTAYSQLEPGDQDSELHSIFGSEFANLPPTLEAYYDPFFINRTLPTKANDSINSLFTSDEQQLSNWQNQINQLSSQAQTAYQYSVGWAYVGNAYENDYNYNIYVRDINSENALIDQYNSLLAQYQLLVGEYNGQPLNTLQRAGIQSN